MISIEAAIGSIKTHVRPLLKKKVKSIEKAGGYRLYNNVKSPINMPPFRQSAMDGYAVNLHDSPNYILVDEIKAGDTHNPYLKKGEAVRIFTGAAVPDTANAIVMQEKVVVNGKSITVSDVPLPEHNIRPVGEQVTAGDIALKANTLLTPAAIGFLLSLGIREVTVFKKPNIAIVTTGNELVDAGKPLSYGKIYESNSKMLLSALYSLKFYDVTLYKVNDDYTHTLQTLSTAIEHNDLVLVTGGISVGDYDFVGKALAALGTEQQFYNVNQKPGKPLFYGIHKATQVFALPGNPAAALTCFYVYVYIALQNMMGRDSLELPKIKAKCLNRFEKKGDRPQFLKACYHNGTVKILDGQNSSMLHTFALANALVVVPIDVSHIEINDYVETILLPH